ncbi:unnamed protein product [Durusdinium trenchii]|uniref:PARP catalytic domain-containing protein n=1 Tax=Durusdinium trenchii TaxID=1381693 RepID=A0ABP0QT18_9DINO
MGSGAAKGKASPREASGDVGLAAPTIQAAIAGNQEAQDLFFKQLNDFAAAGNSGGLKALLQKWPKAAQKHGAREATCAAVKHGQAEALKALLDEGVRPFIGRNDPEVNPLIHAVELREWDCIEMLVPRALKYNFSTGLLQEGMMDFVVAGNIDMMQKLLVTHQIPGNGKLLCAALLLGPEEKAHAMASEIVEHIKDLSQPSSVEPSEEKYPRGWEEFAPIHAACRARKAALLPNLLEFLLGRGVTLSEWGKERSLKTSFAKRLPLHYAAENKHMPLKVVEQLAKAYPDAMFAHVNDRPGRKLPCQCASHNDEMKERLEELMYQHVCSSFDALGKDSEGEYIRLIRLALLFEKVCSLPDTKLSRGSLSFVVESLLPKKLEAQASSADVDFSAEAVRFAEANPRVDLGRDSAAKVKVKSIADIGQVLKSDFWELLKLVEHCGEMVSDLSQFRQMLCYELESRLKWVSQQAQAGKSETLSDQVRYGMFVFAGLIAEVLTAPADEEGEAGEEKGADSVLSSVASSFASSELLEVVVAAYCKELQIPSAWNLLGILQEGLMGQGIKAIVFSGGDLVIKQTMLPGSPRFDWVQGLFENTFLKRYTRDRRGGKVPEALEVKELEQVLNCGSWGEYANTRRRVHGELQERGPAWTGTLRTDECTKGEAAEWFKSEEYPSGVNEHWLYHGTSQEGETGITEGDFRLNLAGSNAGTLYGNGVYLAEAVSKSDEYTTPHGSNDLRTILLCLSCLGRINYNDERRPDGDELAASCQGGGYHSILGDREKIRGTYREIIVFDENLIYPGYICRYRRID